MSSFDLKCPRDKFLCSDDRSGGGGFPSMSACLENVDLLIIILSYLSEDRLIVCERVNRVWQGLVLKKLSFILDNDEASYRFLAYRCIRQSLLDSKRLLAKLFRLRRQSESLTTAAARDVNGSLLLFGSGFAEAAERPVVIDDCPSALSGHVQQWKPYFPGDKLTAVASLFDINRRKIFAFGGFDEELGSALKRIMTLDVDELFAFNRRQGQRNSPSMDSNESMTHSTSSQEAIPGWKRAGLLLPKVSCFPSTCMAPDNKILLTGGGHSPYRGSAVYQSCMLLDPDNDNRSITSVANMLVPRCGHVSLSLYDVNQVIVLGGYGGGMTYYDTVEMFDVSSDRWIALPKMSCRRSCPAAVVGPYGSVYVAGGSANGEIGQRSSERFDPREGRWEVLPDMQLGRGYTSGAATVSGTFMVMGGLHDNSLQGGIEWLDFRKLDAWQVMSGSGRCVESHPEYRSMAHFPFGSFNNSGSELRPARRMTISHEALFLSERPFDGSELIRAGHQCHFIW